MNVPPKIEETPAREVEVEVLPPVNPRPNNEQPPSSDSFPIHALSALTLVAVDSLWALFDLAPPLWIIAIPACFLAVAIPTFLIQKTLKRDTAGRALAFAVVLGTLAAVPTPITGTRSAWHSSAGPA
jgi:hypothetical protein